MSISWESSGCRSEVLPKGSRYESRCPGKRVCHVTEVGYCVCAYGDYSREELPRGQYFPRQLTGAEALYHELAFVNGEQCKVKAKGKEAYLKELREKLK